MTESTAGRIIIPEPGADQGHPAVKIAFDRMGMFVLAFGDPECPITSGADTRDVAWVVNRISDWQVEDRVGKAPGWLSFTDPTFGLEFFLSAHALRSITSVERSFITVMTPELRRKLQRSAVDHTREIAVPRVIR